MAVTYVDKVPSDVLDQICCDVEDEALNFQRQSVPERGIMASGDVWLATAIVFVLFKPYFDEFLKEAGKDHYVVLKKTLKKAWFFLFGQKKTFQVAMVRSRGVVETEYSFLFSICAEISNGRQVKLLLREHCSQGEYTASIDAFLDMVQAYHSGTPAGGTEIDLDTEKDNWGYILVVYDQRTGLLHVYDPVSGR